MKATEANLLKFLKKSPQFVIPIYQRNYSWLPDECRQLWADLLRAGRNDGVAAHFIGSIVYVERALSISDRACILDQGVIVHTGRAADLLADREIQDRYCSV